MKKLTYSIFMMLPLTIICLESFPQSLAALYNQKQENPGMIPERTNDALKAESPIRFQLSTLLGFNRIGSGQKITASVSSNFHTTFENKSLAINPVIDYYWSSKAGAGIGYNGFDNYFEATRYVGTRVNPGGWFIIDWPDTYTDIYDGISIATYGNMFSIHGTYRPVSYSKERHQPCEIITRAGLSMNVIKEEQHLTVFVEKEEWNGDVSFNSQSASYQFTKTALTGFVNAQIVLHATRYFSFVLFDITPHFGLINPEVPLTSVTVDNKKTVVIDQHKLTSSGITIATGLALHF